MDQLSFRYQMVYAIYGDHNPYPILHIPTMVYAIYGDHNPYPILHIPYSMLYAIYDLEGSNDVNLQSTEFDPCR